MGRVVEHTGTLAIHASSYDSVDKSYDGISNVSYAYTAASGSNYCGINLTKGSEAYTYIYFKYDTSSIPNDVTITSISSVIRVAMQSAGVTNTTSRGAKMCSGTTEKTSSVTVSSSAANRTFTMGTWTRAEVSDVRLKLYATRGTSNVNTNYNLRLYGTDLTINYSWYDYYYDTTANSSISGVTVSVSDEEQEKGGNVVVTISGASGTTIAVTDNGEDITEQLVASGSDLVYTITDIGDDHVIEVYDPNVGQQHIYYKYNGTWMETITTYVKQGVTWVQANAAYIKDGGSWNE